jgi:hypothetical protein
MAWQVESCVVVIERNNLDGHRLADRRHRGDDRVFSGYRHYLSHGLCHLTCGKDDHCSLDRIYQRLPLEHLRNFALENVGQL